MQAYYAPALSAWYLGPPPAEARRVWVCIHGRGADAGSILPLGQALWREGDACVAPQAERGTWYPQSFMAQRSANEPYLSRSLAQLQALGEALAAEGLPAEKQCWTGFSQGACLMLEHIYTRHPKVAGVAAFAGGLIGPQGQAWPKPPFAALRNVPVFLSSADPDPHILVSRFNQTTQLFDQAGAHLHSELLPGHGHTLSPGQISRAKAWLG